MRIAPNPSSLHSLKNAAFSWPDALSELIDNSFDAAAKRVDVTFGPKSTCTVADDGIGCASMNSLFTLGDHHQHSSTRLGRYGVGLKHAACWLWGVCKIATSHGTTRRVMSCDWEALSKQTEWDIPDPLDVPQNGKTGTTITFSKITRGFPHDYKRLCQEIAYRFTPGLLLGYQIRFYLPRRKLIVIEPYQMPPLEQIVEDTFDVGGKGVRLKTGIVKEGHDNPKPGWAYCHHHRVIMNTSKPSKDYSTSRIAGQIWLDNSWRLTVHKDDLSDGEEQLADAIYDRCKDILAAAHKQSQSISSAAFTNRVNAKLRAAVGQLKKAKAKRKKGKKQGTVTPTGTGKKHKRAKRKQPGDKMLSDEQIGRLKIDWKSCEDETLGCVDADAALIWLNDDNRYLSEMRKTENDSAVLATAIGLYVNEAVHSGDGQKLLAFMGSGDDGVTFPSRWAEVLNTIVELV